MGVRVKIKVVMANKTLETTALVNTGYETDEPQLLVPHVFLIRNNVDLEDLGRPMTMEYDTAGGPVAMHVYPKACKVAVIEPDKISREVESDLVVSLIEKEVIMSDALIEELGINIINPKTGLWRFTDDPPGIHRRSYKPQLWR